MRKLDARDARINDFPKDTLSQEATREEAHFDSRFHQTPLVVFSRDTSSSLLQNISSSQIHGGQLVAASKCHRVHPRKWSESGAQSGRRSTTAPPEIFAKFPAWILLAARINEDCDSRGTHSLSFSPSMIDPEMERPWVQPARSRSAADRATSPCRSSLDEIRPAILRFVESQANAKCRREKKKRTTRLRLVRGGGARTEVANGEGGAATGAVISEVVWIVVLRATGGTRTDCTRRLVE